MIDYITTNIGDTLLLTIKDGNENIVDGCKDLDPVVVIGEKIEDDEGMWPMIAVQTATGRILELGPGWFLRPHNHVLISEDKL